MLNVIVSGLATGAFYVAIVWGVAVALRFTHLLSFAIGAIATLAAYIVYWLLDEGVGYLPAVLIAVVLAVLVNVGLNAMLVRVTPGGDFVITSIATLGPGLALMGLISIIWGEQIKVLPAPSWLEGSLRLGSSVTVPRAGLVTIGIVGLATIALVIVLTRSRTGVLLRAMADSRAVSAGNALQIRKLDLIVWSGSGALAAVAGIIITPQLSLSPTALTNLLIIALAAGVMGGLDNLSGVLIGGLVFGAVVGVANFYFQAQVTATAALIVLIVVLAFKPTGIVGQRAADGIRFFPDFIEYSAGKARRRPRRRPARHVPLIRISGPTLPPAVRRSWRLLSSLPGAAVLVVVVLALAPLVISDSGLLMITLAVLMSVSIAGQSVLSEQTGLFSLAQGGFMLLGSYAAGLFAVHTGISGVPAILVAGLAGALLSTLIGFCVGKLSGLYLAILTSLVSLSIPELASNLRSLTHGSNGLYLPSLSLFGVDVSSGTGRFHLALGTTIVALVAVALFKRSTVGLMCQALRDTPTAALSIGISVPTVRLVAFAVAGACAGVSGGATALIVAVVAPTSFTIWTTIYVVLGATIAGATSRFVGPLIGGLIVVGIPYVLSEFNAVSQIAFGLALTVAISVRAHARARSQFLMAKGDGDAGDDEQLPRPVVAAPA
mgnify:CR=1 FL=1